MPIRYSLHDNRLTPDPDDRFARVESDRTVGLDEVADRIAGAGSTVTRVDALSVLEALQGVLQEYLVDGAHVSLPFANFRVGIQGVFADDDDQFDASRHAVVPRVQAGAALRRAFAGPVPTAKVAASRPAPAVLHVTDLNTGERDAALTPGGMAEVTGTRLRVDPSVAGEGVVFVAEADGAETAVEVFGQNAPRRLLFLVPAGLAAGGYRVAVRATFGSELREGRSDAVLTVA